jgi:hypothetical protein
MEDLEPTPEELQRRTDWFTRYVDALRYESVRAEKAEGVLYRCPCCGCKTLDERGGFDICPVCFWEDDGQDDADADIVRGGPNGRLSLSNARKNFKEIGACESRHLRHVRMPTREEE